MAGVILRIAAGTLLYVAFLWLVRIDDWRIAGMMLTFPMLNGIGLVSAGGNSDRLTKAMMPVITLNGLMCFLVATALATWDVARSHPLAVTGAAAAAWLAVYSVLEARNLAFARTATLDVFVVGCAIATAAVTYWFWPGCVALLPAGSSVRSGGFAGVIENWVTILLFALSLALLFGFAHRYSHAHAAIGRLAALPAVPLFGLYTVGTVAAADAAGLAKLQTMQSMVLVGWIIAAAFAVAFSRYVMVAARTGSAMWTRVAALILGWVICLALIVGAARVASTLSACSGA
jgi:hypothetical protein